MPVWQSFGKRLDPETGFSYFGKRYYNPNTLNWLTPDPLEDADGPNYYAFVHNNPLNYIDPDGRFAIVIPIVTISFGAMEAAFAWVTAETLVGIAIGTTLGVAVYEGAKALDAAANKESEESSGNGKKPQGDYDFYDEPPNHPNYHPPKNWNGQKVKNPNGAGSGFPHKNGDVWVPTDHKGTHAPHWDIQHPNGQHTNIYP